MNSLAYKYSAHASSVSFTENELVVTLSDGRVLSVPLAWFPRLLNASAAQLSDYQLLGEGEGIHWPAIDEDISVAGLLEGRPSVEYAAR